MIAAQFEERTATAVRIDRGRWQSLLMVRCPWSSCGQLHEHVMPNSGAALGLLVAGCHAPPRRVRCYRVEMPQGRAPQHLRDERADVGQRRRSRRTKGASA